ncbi:ABC transporter substrate-binding protein [Nocardioides ginkgobilobae]
MRKKKTSIAVLAVSAMLVTGCSSKAGTSEEIAGVSDDSITLGSLLDLGGPFAATGKDVLAGTEIAATEINEAGGICERQIELVNKDHGYDTQRGVVAYEEAEPEVAMFLHLMGSALTAAIHDQVIQDEILAMPTSYSSELLGADNFVVLGATYDVGIINSIDWMVQEGMVEEGDTIGELYLEGEWGESSHAGVEYATEQLGLDVTSHMTKVTDSDFAAQMADMRKKDVSAIVIAGTGTQVATIAALAETNGLDVPIMGNGPTWNVGMLETSSADALTNNFHRPWISYSLDDNSEKSKELTALYDEANDNPPMSGSGVSAGYAAVYAAKAILEETCDDLSRPAILEARKNTAPFDAEGLFPSLDISDPSKPSSTEVVIESVDPDAPDGMSTTDLFSSELAEQYVDGL